MATEETVAAICGKEKTFAGLTESTGPLVLRCNRAAGHTGEHGAPNIDPAVGDVTWFDGCCGSPSPARLGPSQPAIFCLLERGHFGAHSDGEVTWSAAPPLGPVPERFRRPTLDESAQQIDWQRLRRAAGEAPTLPLGMASDPGSTPEVPEVLAAGLVACGRALGRIEQELAQRKHWQKVIAAATRTFSAGPESVPTEHEWATAGRFVYASVQLVADAPQSEPIRPIQERAEALMILLLQGRRLGSTPNFLIRAGAVLEVARSAWRKARAGQS